MSAYDTAVLADSPVLYVKDTLTDAGSGAHTVSAIGSPTASVQLPNGDGAWVFDATGTQYLSVADAADLSVITSTRLTVECWAAAAAVNQPNAVDTGYVNFVGKTGFNSGSGSNQYEWELRYFNDNTTDSGNAGRSLCAYAFPSLAGGIGSGFDDHNGVSPGCWFHTVGVYDCSGVPSSVTIYRDGVQANSTTFTGTPQNGTNPVTIGASEVQEAGHSWWYGWIGKIAVYSTALSSAQVLAHYNAMTKPGRYTPGPRTGAWV